jgi:hypothetical protein
VTIVPSVRQRAEANTQTSPSDIVADGKKQFETLIDQFNVGAPDTLQNTKKSTAP